MKTPIKMYTLKPVFDQNFHVEIPKCMYKVENIHSRKKVNYQNQREEDVQTSSGKLEIIDQVKQFLKNCPSKSKEMAELEMRQRGILEQIAQLKKQIFTLKQDLNAQQNGTTNKIVTSDFVCDAVAQKIPSQLETLVVTINPISPLYSLEMLQRTLRNEISLIFTCYRHSSVKSLPESAKDLQERLNKFVPLAGTPLINIRLIWKEISSNAEFLLSHLPIIGEVNLLRYVSRSINPNYESDTDFIEIESLLDQCYLFSSAKSKNERANFFSLLNQSLKKSTWLLGKNQPHILDITAFSVIKQCCATNELGANLTKWFQKCSSL